MRICVYGAGAIGGYLAVGLATAGHDVCVIARGAHLEAIRAHGLKLRMGGTERVVRVAASDDPRDFGHQQDLERGRALELDALVTVVQELGRLTGVPTPMIDTVLALAKEKGRSSCPERP